MNSLTCNNVSTDLAFEDVESPNLYQEDNRFSTIEHTMIIRQREIHHLHTISTLAKEMSI